MELTNEQLAELAQRLPPPQWWFDGEDDNPFVDPAGRGEIVQG